jgi:deoxyribodipyrimidine photo-lyase
MPVDRTRYLKEGPFKKGPVIYWMSRDQRVRDNWAFLHAQELALAGKVPLLVLFCLVPQFLGATLRQYAFMIRGLQEVEENLDGKRIPFYCLSGEPGDRIPAFVKQVEASCLITDFDPLRVKRIWKDTIATAIEIPFHEVDAHNIIPCWIASPKQEFGAYTFRPKHGRLVSAFLADLPVLKKHPYPWPDSVPGTDWESLLKELPLDRSVPEIDWLKPGEKAAHQTLKRFIDHTLVRYPQQRNDPNQQGQSNLSPYLHFGHLSPQRVAQEIRKAPVELETRKNFLEEQVIRRELSDNYCFYNSDYDKFSGFPAWAQKTLTEHQEDRREYLYSFDQLEKAQTHDPLWNAAQLEMVNKGKMHGYLRMYWAKKILEWTPSPEEAQRIAIALNDKYELDGRDPNGYTGIAWSIGGLHDRAWGERPVFGKIRYMSYKGARSKFDVDRYVEENLSKRELD